ncbi:MAG: YqiJ family protein [bacterium]|nr:YqiJ family protein [bacterium]
MQEILDHSINSVNIIPTTILIFCILYWIIVMLGFIDIDSLDIDADFDADIDVDVDADVDVDGPDSGSIGWLNQVLVFFNISHVPLMIFLSFFALSTWFASMATNYYLNNQNFLLSLVFLVPILLGSLFVAKFATIPFVKLFRHLSSGEISIESYIGKICRVILVAKEGIKGQAEIKIEGGSYLINTKTQPGVTISKGENGLIIDYDEQDKSYLIEPYYE